MTTARLDASAYRTAERLLRHHRRELVLGGKVRPQWIDGGTRFWYTVDTTGGRRFILVDPEAGSRGPAFDHERLAAALADAAGEEVDPAALPFGAIELTGHLVEFDAFGAHWRCPLDTYGYEKVEDHRPRSFLEIPSPDGKQVVFRSGHDLGVRSQDGEERALTDDGDADCDYGTSPFTLGVLMSKVGLPHLPPAVAWSPDSTRVLTHRTDQRGVRRTHLVEAMPADGGEPRLHTQRYAFPGDDRVPLGELVVIDVESGATTPANVEPFEMPLLSPITTRWAWWAGDGSTVYFLHQSRDGHTLRLQRLDPATGEVRTVLEETGETRVEPSQYLSSRPMVRMLPGGDELLWYSQRDGWGHLYRYDAQTGELRGQVTSGEWAVQEILHVDAAAGVVYFVASGLVAADPYRRSVCRVGLDGTGFARLTDDELDHVVTVPESAAYFVDSASTTDTAPVTTVRGWDGRVVVELERADVSRLAAAGWTPPERFRVKAADGVTDIYGLLYRPHGFDAQRRYPVIDNPYPGPQINRVQPAFDQGYLGADAEAVAALGFVVIAVDGRGTPGRSKAFHDASYGRLSDAGGLADHVAALRQLAETRPWMDLDRVGIFGMSGGGYATVRAMGDFPDVYKVGVSECGNHDNRFYHRLWGETYDGPLDAETYARSSNVEIADKLEGKLLLVHGGMDDNVPPHLTLRLVDRLIAADKDFELLIIPGAEHVFLGYEHYLNRRKWDFLVRHLMGIEPPAGYRLSPVPIDMEAIAEVFG